MGARLLYNSAMKYAFYGADTPALSPIDPTFAAVGDQRRLYDILSDVWCEYTCAPRLRPEWSKENRTLGQCSITAFLAQDIYGGEVYGIPLEGGGYHCYNAVGEVVFDLILWKSKPLPPPPHPPHLLHPILLCSFISKEFIKES